MNEEELKKMSVKDLRSFISKNKYAKNLGGYKKAELIDIVLKAEAKDEDEKKEKQEDNTNEIGEVIIPTESKTKISVFYNFSDDQLLKLIEAFKKL